MDLKNLQTFIMVAELGSFTKAAEKLGYSQSTVSFQIKQLETELNTQLFERINHTVALTERGRESLKDAHEISKLARKMGEESDVQAPVRGHVRVAMSDSLCSHLLGEELLDFWRQNPGITLQVINTGTEEMFRLLDHNEADFVFTLDSHIYNAEYVIVQEEKVGMHFVVKADSPLCRQRALPLEELVRQPFLLTEKGMSYRRLMDERLASLSLEVQPILEVGNTDVICRLVEQGAGISFLPDYATEQSVAEGRMAYLHTEELKVEVWRQILYHRDKWVSPQMQQVIEFFR